MDMFPEAYQDKINILKKYFLHFELDFFTTVIRENKFKISHIVAPKNKIIVLQEEETRIFFDHLFKFESLLSISVSIYKRGFTFPIIGDREFSIKVVYHPLLPKPVLNNVSLDKQVVVVTGPNMAGKSTFLKAIAIAVYSGHLGFAIPADEAKFPFFHNICVFINHTDNLEKGYSHFLREVKNLKEVALTAAKGIPIFAIFDEIFKGTNMEDALEITRTTLQGLARFHGSVFFISAHMDELKDMTGTTLNSYFLDCTIDNGIPQFSYHLKSGWSSVQIGKILFKNEGLYNIFQSYRAE
ncbi:MutS-related protein [Sphingobacterium thalpophilum]|uniref:MutS-related protein n=1 Tax=Sphingobacterium thalpophilum TaxID=259 RepID=UPI003DA4699E